MITTVIPAAPGAEAKTRLAGVLDPPGRRALARSLLAHTIAAARPLGPVLVVSRSPGMRRLARGLGADTLDEDRQDLNAAIARGLRAVADHVDTALVLPGDLPWVTTADLRAVVAAAGSAGEVVVVVPCQRDQGTNALLLRPPDLLAPAFEGDSHHRHVAAARAAGIPVLVHRSRNLADLDTPADLERLGTDVDRSDTAGG